MKENNIEWISLYNQYPTATLEDFEKSGITKEDVKLEDIDFYRKQDLVQKSFVKPDNSFDEDKFKTWYNGYNDSYNKFLNDQYTKDFSNTSVQTNLSSNALFNRIMNSKSVIVYPEVKRKVDVFGRTTGFQGVNSISEAYNSEREFMQQHPLYDEKGNKTDKTVEEFGFLNALTNPIRQAVYDKDEKDENGQIINKKGDRKLDKDGLPYMELIGDRNNSGLEEFQLNPFDILTKEKSSLNSFDIFDDDDLNKNDFASLAKNAGKVGLMYAAKRVPILGQILSLAMMGMSMADYLPEYGKLGLEFMSDDLEATKNTETYKMLNKIQSQATKFNSSQSDYARENMFSIEGIANLAPIIYSQLFQMQGAAMAGNGLSKILGASDNVASSIGSMAGKGFMVAMGASEISKEVNKLDLDPKAKAAIVGSTGAFLGVLYNLPFGTWAMKLLGDKKNIIGHVIKKETEAWKQTLGKNVSETTATEQQGLIDKIKKGLSSVFAYEPNVYQNTVAEYLKAAGAEGLEEITEQGIMDGVKQAYNMNVGGFKDKNKGKEFENLWNPESYGQAGFGGAFGGGMFRALGYKEDKNKLPESINDLFDNKDISENDINKEIDKLIPNYISTKLSTEVDDNGNYKPVSETLKSQADNVKDFLKNTVREVKLVRDNIGTITEITNAYDKDVNNTLLNMKLDTSLRDDINSKITDIVELKEKLKTEMARTLEDGQLNPNVNTIKNEIAIKNQELLDIKNRVNTDYYFQEGLYNINSDVQDAFLNEDSTKDKIARRDYFDGNEAKGYSNLSNEDKIKVNQQYIADKQAKNDNIKADIRQSRLKLEDLITKKQKSIEAIETDVVNQTQFNGLSDNLNFLNSIADKEVLTLNEKNRLALLNKDLDKVKTDNTYSEFLNFNKEGLLLNENEDFGGFFDPKFRDSAINDIYNQAIKDTVGIDLNNTPIENNERFEATNQVNQILETDNNKYKKLLENFQNLIQANPELNLAYKLSLNPELFNKPLSHQFTETEDKIAYTVMKGKTDTDNDFENYQDFDAAVKEYKKLLSILSYTGFINPEVEKLRRNLMKSNPLFKEGMSNKLEKAKQEGKEYDLLFTNIDKSRELIKHIKSQIDTLSKFRDKAYENSTKKMKLVRYQWLKDIQVKYKTIRLINKFLPDGNKLFTEDEWNELTNQGEYPIDEVSIQLDSYAGKPITNFELVSQEQKKSIGKEESGQELVALEAANINKLFKQLALIEAELNKKLQSKDTLTKVLQDLYVVEKKGDDYVLNNNTIDSELQIDEDCYLIPEQVIGDSTNRTTKTYVMKGGSDPKPMTDDNKASVRTILSQDGFNYLLYLHLSDGTSHQSVWNTLYNNNDNKISPLNHQYNALIFTDALIKSGDKIEKLGLKLELKKGDPLADFQPNMLMIDGTVGTGKSYLMKQINLMQNKNVVYYAPNQTQRDNLKGYVADDIEFLHNGNLSNNADGTNVTEVMLKSRVEEIYKVTPDKVIVIDEIQSFSKKFVQDINKIGAKLVLVGDLQQLGAVDDTGNRNHLGDGMLFFKTAKFDFTVRNNYDNIPDTIKAVRDRLTPLQNKSGSDVIRHDGDNAVTTSYFLNKLPTNSTDPNYPKEITIFNGAYVVDENENAVLQAIVNDLKLDDKKTISIIGSLDNPKTTSYVQRLRDLQYIGTIDVLSSNEIKGLERDYVILTENYKTALGIQASNDKRELEFLLTNIGRVKRGIVLSHEDVKFPTSVAFKNKLVKNLIKRTAFDSTFELDNLRQFTKVASNLGDEIKFEKSTAEPEKEPLSEEEQIKADEKELLNEDVFDAPEQVMYEDLGAYTPNVTYFNHKDYKTLASNKTLGLFPYIVIDAENENHTDYLDYVFKMLTNSSFKPNENKFIELCSKINNIPLGQQTKKITEWFNYFKDIRDAGRFRLIKEVLNEEQYTKLYGTGNWNKGATDFYFVEMYLPGNEAVKVRLGSLSMWTLYDLTDPEFPVAGTLLKQLNTQGKDVIELKENPYKKGGSYNRNALIKLQTSIPYDEFRDKYKHLYKFSDVLIGTNKEVNGEKTNVNKGKPFIIFTAVENNGKMSDIVWIDKVLRGEAMDFQSGIIYLNEPSTTDSPYKVSELLNQVNVLIKQELDKANKVIGYEIENRLDKVNMFKVIEAINYYTNETLFRSSDFQAKYLERIAEYNRLNPLETPITAVSDYKNTLRNLTNVFVSGKDSEGKNTFASYEKITEENHGIDLEYVKRGGNNIPIKIGNKDFNIVKVNVSKLISNIKASANTDAHRNIILQGIDDMVGLRYPNGLSVNTKVRKTNKGDKIQNEGYLKSNDYLAKSLTIGVKPLPQTYVLNTKQFLEMVDLVEVKTEPVKTTTVTPKVTTTEKKKAEPTVVVEPNAINDTSMAIFAKYGLNPDNQENFMNKLNELIITGKILEEDLNKITNNC